MTKAVVRLLCAAVFCGALATPALAQDQFNAVPQNNAPESFQGGNSKPTGTQGVVGNPFCPPPHEIINGKDVTPLNWSCPTVQQPYVMPQHMTIAKPGPQVPAGVANPCQPGGPGGYNFLNNPVGTALPAGCVRPKATTITKRDASYQLAPINPNRSTPVPPGRTTEQGPPGSYLGSTKAGEPEQEGPPGSYLESTAQSGGQGAPGSYLQPDGSPGSYLPRNVGATEVERSPTGAIELTPGTQANAEPAQRINNEPLSGGIQSGRQDYGSMQPQLPNVNGAAGALGGLLNGLVNTPRQTAPAKKTVTANKATTAAQKAAAQKAAQAAANAKAVADAAKLMNLFVNTAQHH